MTFILLGVGIILAMLYPKIRQKAAHERYQKQLDALPKYERDLSTPQGAILCLEDAYRKEDMEAVLACRDFVLEASLIAEEQDPNLFNQEAILKLAHTLELAFRQEVEQSWPDFKGLESYFDGQEPYRDNVVVVTEICRFPDGGYSKQRILVGKTGDQWKVLQPLE